MNKMGLIRAILKNEVYQQDSGLYQTAEAGLAKLSVAALDAIFGVVDQSRWDAANRQTGPKTPEESNELERVMNE